MREEVEYSILQKKFREWFWKTVPAAIPSPDEVDRSVRNPVPADLPLSTKKDLSIGDPVLADLPLTAEVENLNHRTRRRHGDNSQELLELLGFGFRGAISLGAIVGVVIVFLNLSFWGWYPHNWPNQLLFIFFAILLGFYIGLSKGYISQQREKYFYEGEF